MHETEEQVRPADRTAAPQWTPRSLPVRLLTTHEDHQGVAVLSVRGDIDLATAPLLREALEPVLQRETGPVVVDLSEVPFMDSTGVHALIDTLRRLEPQDRRLTIACREGGLVHRLIAMVGLLDVLSLHRSRESAVSGGDDVLRPEPGIR